MKSYSAVQKFRWGLGAMGLVFGSLSTLPAYAVPMLDLSVAGGPSVTISDNGAGDLSSTAGTVVFNGSLGNFLLNVTTGLTKPTLGSAAFPHMDLNSVNLSSWGGGQLTIKFTDTGFTNLVSPTVSFISAIGGGTTGNVSFATYLDAGNNPFAMTTLISDVGSFSSLAFSNGTLESMAITGPYSLTMVATITHGGDGINSSSFNGTLKVPEPTAVLLLGTGLLVTWVIMGPLARRRVSH